MTREKYRQTGFKLTPQRLAILDYLEGNKNHPCAEDVYRAVSRRFPTMSLATVYNTLDVLRRRGGVSELTIDPIKKRFDSSGEPHHHLICLLCKRIVDIHRDFSLHLSAADAEHFQLVGNHIEFYGICPQCKGKSSKNEPRKHPGNTDSDRGTRRGSPLNPIALDNAIGKCSRRGLLRNTCGFRRGKSSAGIKRIAKDTGE